MRGGVLRRHKGGGGRSRKARPCGETTIFLVNISSTFAKTLLLN